MLLDSTHKVEETEYVQSFYKVNGKLAGLSRSSGSLNLGKDYPGFEAAVLVEQSFKSKGEVQKRALKQLREEYEQQNDEDDAPRQDTFGLQPELSRHLGSRPTAEEAAQYHTFGRAEHARRRSDRERTLQQVLDQVKSESKFLLESKKQFQMISSPNQFAIRVHGQQPLLRH